MQRIFDDELRGTGQIRPNPHLTRPGLPLSIVAAGLKWPALRRRPRLVSGKPGHAGTAILSVEWPWEKPEKRSRSYG